MELYTYELLHAVSFDAIRVTAQVGDTLHQIGPDQYKLHMNRDRASLNWSDRSVQEMVERGLLKVIEVKGENLGEKFEDHLPPVIHADQVDADGKFVVENAREPKKTSYEVVKQLTPRDPNAKKTTSEIVMILPTKGVVDPNARKKQSQEIILKINKDGSSEAPKQQSHSEIVKMKDRNAPPPPPPFVPQSQPPVSAREVAPEQSMPKAATPKVRVQSPRKVNTPDHLNDAQGEAAVVGSLVKRVNRRNRA